MIPTRGMGASNLIVTGGLGPWLIGAPIVPFMIFMRNVTVKVARLFNVRLGGWLLS